MHSQLSRDEMESALLVDVQIRQEYGRNHTGMSHLPLYKGIPGVIEKYHHTETTVVVWVWLKPITHRKPQI